jgi:hypothetical protein
MTKQTAVEYLLEEFSAIIGRVNFTVTQDLFIRDAVIKAKQMEKEQIIKAYDESNKRLCLQCTDFKTGIKYYNETFKNETK